MSLFLPGGGAGGVDELPEARVAGQFLVLGAGELGAKGKILEGVFVKDAVDDEPPAFLFKVDAVIPGAVAVEGAVGAFDRAEPVGMAAEEIGSEHVEFPQNLHLKGGGKLADFRGACRREDDLKGRHGQKFKFKLKSK